MTVSETGEEVSFPIVGPRDCRVEIYNVQIWRYSCSPLVSVLPNVMHFKLMVKARLLYFQRRGGVGFGKRCFNLHGIFITESILFKRMH